MAKPLHYISEELRTLAKPISWFKVDPKNARKHSTFNVATIQASLQDAGQVKPVVALKDGTLVAGHGTLQAAKGLGWDHLAVVIMTDKAKAAGFAIADNRTAELATWDDAMLAEALKDLKPKGLHRVGFSDADLAALLKQDSEDAGNVGAKKKPSRLVHTCPKCGHKFGKDADK